MAPLLTDNHPLTPPTHRDNSDESVSPLTHGQAASGKPACISTSVLFAGPKVTTDSPVLKVRKGFKETRQTMFRPNHDISSLAPTPIKVSQLKQLLLKYPNVEARSILIDGFERGFRVKYSGVRRARHSLNLKSVRENIELAKEKLAQEVELGRVAGPFTHPPFEHFQVSPLGLVPKKKPGEYRLIPRESKKIVQELQMSLTLIKSLNHRFVVVLMKKT